MVSVRLDFIIIFRLQTIDILQAVEIELQNQ